MAMIGGIPVPAVISAAGAQNFFAHNTHRHGGWWWHSPWRALGLRSAHFAQMMFTTKTVTLGVTPGNMPLKADGVTPQELLPRCIMSLPGRHTLNCVELSGLGAAFYFSQGIWQTMPEPFFLSFMAASPDKEGRLEEVREFSLMAREAMRHAKSNWIMQLNFGCPNTGHGLDERRGELHQMIEICQAIGIPVTLNFSAAAPFEILAEAATNPGCAALFICNTIEYGLQGVDIDWEQEFGSAVSPLISKRGFGKPGGLSGPSCYPKALNRCLRLRVDEGVRIPIFVGNGIDCEGDVRNAKANGASGVVIGITAPMHYPWRMRGIIAAAHDLFE